MGSRYRHELKYICSDVEIELIKNRISTLLTLDRNAGSDGEYLIRSIYFDDYNRRCYYENEEGVDPRYKYRIRAYNCSPARISLEKKRKINGMTAKESCLLDIEVCNDMLVGNRCIQHIGKHSLLDQWILERNTRFLQPEVLVEYRRKAFIYHLGNVRITFDSQICASRQTERLFEKNIESIPILPSGFQVLEVKYDEFLPDTIYKLCETGHQLQSTFSKFYLCCKAMEGNTYVI